VGRGVFVGSGVGVGTLTRSLPTEHPRLPTNIITSNKLDTDLSLVNKLSILLLAVNSSSSSFGNSCPDAFWRRGEKTSLFKVTGPVDRVTMNSYFCLNRIKSQTHWLGSVLYDSVTTGET
jgi:hypothetical protein